MADTKTKIKEDSKVVIKKGNTDISLKAKVRKMFGVESFEKLDLKRIKHNYYRANIIGKDLKINRSYYLKILKIKNGYVIKDETVR